MTERNPDLPTASTGPWPTEPAREEPDPKPADRALTQAPSDPEIVVHSTLPSSGARPVVRVSVEVPPGVAVSIHIEAQSSGDPVSVRRETLLIGRPEGALQPQAVSAPIMAEPQPGNPPLPAPATRLAPEAPPELERAPEPLSTSPAGRALRSAWVRLSADAFPVTRFNVILLGALTAVYLLTRLVALDQFPIYFFSDEASVALIGRAVVQNGFADGAGNMFPVYFEAAPQRFTPVITAYALGLATMWFGNSIEVVRGASAVISVLGVVAVALAAHRVFKARFWWVTILVFTLSPIWLIHSRTGFETTAMASFYAGFMLFYLLYRERSPLYGFPALFLGALTFYSYSNAQAIMAVTGLLLLISDWRYHFGLSRQVRIGLVLWAIAMAGPLISFQWQHQDALGTHLRAVNSYLFSQDLTWYQKAGMYLERYAYGLSPQYWFWPNNTDLVRHRIPGQAQLLAWGFPFFALGAWVILRNLKSPTHRAVALMALAAPAGAATLEIGAARVMTFVPPAIMMIALGVDWLVARLPRLHRSLTEGLIAGVAGLGGIVAIAMTFQSAPLWFSDYGLYGMQYGAKQIFVDLIPALLRANPQSLVLVSSTWANGTDRYREFFLDGPAYDHVAIRGIDWYQSRLEPLDDNVIFIGTQSELQSAQDSGKFETITPEQTLFYPDGTPGYYVFRARYRPEALALFEAEAEARKLPVTEQAQLDGQTVTFTHSLFDMGTAAHLLDKDLFTLVRGMEANPLLLQVDFGAPRPITTVVLTTGTMDLFTLTVRAYPDPAADPIVVSQQFINAGADPTVRIELPETGGPFQRLAIEIHDEISGESANIHVRELELEP